MQNSKQNDGVNSVYKNKYINVVDIIEEWLLPYGGVAGKDILEFGCGDGTVAIGMALRKSPKRVVAVGILDLIDKCEENAISNIGLNGLSDNLHPNKDYSGAAPE